MGSALLSEDRGTLRDMDFLKSAVASIAKGPAFPYSFGEKLDLDQSIWSLHNGTKRVGLQDGGLNNALIDM